jgi:glycosyltransferase involved in cell wall biosynthesis
MARFLFISTAEGLSWGGSEVLWAKVARELLSMGHHVAYSYAYFAEEPAPLRELRAVGAMGYYRGDPADASRFRRIRRFVQRKKARADFPAFTVPHWLLSLVMEEKPDLVVLNCCDAYHVWPLARAFQALKRQGIAYAVICQLEDDSVYLSDTKREALVQLYGGASRVFFGASYGAELVQRQLACSLESIEIMDNPPNCSCDYVKWPDDAQTAHFACVGRLDVGAKGQDRILAALAGPALAERNWRLTFYGKGWEEAYLRRLVTMYGLSERVHFAGFVSGIDAVWSREHLCLQPSPKEGTPMTVVEAMFAGRPCLVTDIGRMPDLIEEGRTGWVCSRGVASLSTALERAWAQRTQWQTMGQTAHETINRVWNFDYPKQMADRFVRLAEDGSLRSDA